LKERRPSRCRSSDRRFDRGLRRSRVPRSRAIDRLDAGDLLMVTRLDRLARSTRDLLKIFS